MFCSQNPPEVAGPVSVDGGKPVRAKQEEWKNSFSQWNFEGIWGKQKNSLNISRKMRCYVFDWWSVWISVISLVDLHPRVYHEFAFIPWLRKRCACSTFRPWGFSVTEVEWRSRSHVSEPSRAPGLQIVKKRKQESKRWQGIRSNRVLLNMQLLSQDQAPALGWVCWECSAGASSKPLSTYQH